MKKLFHSWSTEIALFMDAHEFTAMGLFDCAGRALYLNAGMRALLTDQLSLQNLLMPAFESLLDSEGGKIYSGWLTFGGPDLSEQSLRGEIWRRDDQILILAVIDVQYECDRRINSFARSLAHQLKNPLAEIIGYALFLADDWETLSGAEREEFLGYIAQGGEKMNQVLNSLLDHVHQQTTQSTQQKRNKSSL